MKKKTFVFYHKSRLFIENISASALVDQFKTPLYVYSKAAILSQYKKLSHAFSQRPTLICYALKANSNASLCRLLLSEGSGADVVSGGELKQALCVGFLAKNILFSGVGKSKDEMIFGIQSKILAFNVESFEELRALEGVARTLKRKAPISVRVNFPIEAQTHPHTVTAGHLSKFGVDKNVALKMYAWAKKSPWLEIRGMHCHIGSQILSYEPYALAARLAGAFVRKLEAQKIQLSFVDMGGGFGIASQNEKDLDISKVANAFNQELKDWPSLKLIIEPGRFLIANSGVLLSQVIYLKKNKNRRFVVIDAGMNDFLRPALYNAKHPVWPVIQKRGSAQLFDVAGPICESADFFARDLRMPAPKSGEALAILNAGAYGFSMSSHYNFRPRPAEVLVDGGKAHLIRHREMFEDLIRTETC